MASENKRTVTPEERAEKLVQRFAYALGDQEVIALRELLYEINAMAARVEAEAFEEAAKILAMLAGAKRQCADTNDGHDDRWCSVCENMSDAYEYAESQIRALAKGLK